MDSRRRPHEFGCTDLKTCSLCCRYIEYEGKLEALRKHRKKKLRIKGEGSGSLTSMHAILG